MQPQQPQDLAPPLPEKTKQRSAEDAELSAADADADGNGAEQASAAADQQENKEEEALSPAELRRQHRRPRRALLQRGARARREGE